MAETVARPEAEARREPELLPAADVDLRRALRIGISAGIVTIFVSAIGMLVSFEERKLVETLTLGTVLLVAIPSIAGSIAGRPPTQLEGFAAQTPGPRNALAGAIAGAVGGLLAAAFLVFVANVNIRSIFVNVSPELVDTLALGLSVAAGAAVLIGVFAVAGAIGGASHLLQPRLRRALLSVLGWIVLIAMFESVVSQVLRSAQQSGLRSLLYTAAGALSAAGAILVAVVAFAASVLLSRRERTFREQLDAMAPGDRRRAVSAVLVVLILILAVLPQVLGQFLAEVADQAMIFMLMALGLNIVVGFAGLLDLGYVAFFAVGAYTTAVLTSPSSPGFSPELTFFAALPFVVVAAAVAGLLVGTPVLRMRGDYLAIVTLGFGEIARLLALSDWLKGTLGGAQGIILIPDIVIGPLTIRGPQAFLYGITAFALLAAYVSYALQDSRMGRAWMAMREDESVAEAMGVNIVAAKLWAFVIGAVLASFGGALFATKIGSIFPNSFDIVTSITILVIVIVGGLGSVPGVVVAALLLIGVPELLREFEEFRFLLYGALLIYMMLQRPEGLIPSRRRAQELHEEEVLQDAWLRAEREQREVEEEGVPGTHGGT